MPRLKVNSPALHCFATDKIIDMKTNSIAFAARAKGPLALLKRTHSITKRYGLTPTEMDRALHLFAQTLGRFNCGASFPLTAVALKRNHNMITKYPDQNIEFAVHGYTHIDYSQLPLEEQLTHLRRACEVFAAAGVKAVGFRCPYLRWSADTLTALKQQELVYDSSQALAWDVLDNIETEAYHRVLDFYSAQSATDHPALPQLIDNLVRIPYCLPDDEALVDRLQLTDTKPMTKIWLEILRHTYELGELFTLGLHPERITLCEEPLRAVLSQARSLSPSVWIARLDEIATWWHSRTAATYQVIKEAGNSFRLIVNGPPGTTILARSVTVKAPTEPWANGYQRVLSNNFVFQAHKMPFIGLPSDSPSALTNFLQQQGYLVGSGVDAQSCAFFLDRTHFTSEDERPLLIQVEKGVWPLVRLARWPDGAQSALSVTGDIDALTLWDYALRVFGS
jgi:peptidoglycan/xylan/chitin deacetylase (PgdA/CDA1 family)